MASNRELWTERVASWRSSGRSAKDFSRGQPFSHSALLYWASRLRKEARAEQETQPKAGITGAATGPSLAKQVRLARVIRRPGAESMAHPPSCSAPAVVGGCVWVVVGEARVMVDPGFDPATLGKVLDVLEGRARAHGGLR
jgi:hypothetical protein